MYAAERIGECTSRVPLADADALHFLLDFACNPDNDLFEADWTAIADALTHTRLTHLNLGCR